MDTHFAIVETNSANQFSTNVKDALTSAMLGHGKLTDADALALDGMSGRKYRLFINNLIGSIADARYLEVGVWQGSTFCSAIYKNNVHALAIDNWTQFGGPAGKFFLNLSRFKGEATVGFIHNDFHAVNFSALGKFNVYFFDGPHTATDHYDGVTLVQPALDDQFILLVDDWNWLNVRDGTTRALAAAALRLDFVAEIRTTLDNQVPAITGKASDWHNGYFIATCSKAPSNDGCLPAGGI